MFVKVREIYKDAEKVWAAITTAVVKPYLLSVNDMIKISTTSGKTVEGEVFAIDPVSKAIAVKNDGAYVIVNSSHIESISGDLASIKTPDIAKLGVSLNKMEKKEAMALEAAETKISSLNAGVSVDTQTLFDRLHLLYRCTWRGNSILLLEEYIIEPPYTTVKILPGKTPDADAFDRLTRTLEGERRKLKL